MAIRAALAQVRGDLDERDAEIKSLLAEVKFPQLLLGGGTLGPRGRFLYMQEGNSPQANQAGGGLAARSHAPGSFLEHLAPCHYCSRLGRQAGRAGWHDPTEGTSTCPSSWGTWHPVTDMVESPWQAHQSEPTPKPP